MWRASTPAIPLVRPCVAHASSKPVMKPPCDWVVQWCSTRPCALPRPTSFGFQSLVLVHQKEPRSDRLLIVSISRVPHLTLSEWPCWVAARLAEECLKDCRPYRSCFRSLASARAVLVAHAPPVFPILYLLLILKRWLSSLVMWWWS